MPTPRRRVAAVAAIALAAAVVAITAWRVVDDLRLVLVHVPLLVVAEGAALYWVTRTGVRRAIGIAVFAAAVIAFFSVAFLEGVVAFGLAVVRLAMLVGAWGLGRYALGRDTATMRATPSAGDAVPPAREPVLISQIEMPLCRNRPSWRCITPSRRGLGPPTSSGASRMLDS